MLAVSLGKRPMLSISGADARRKALMSSMGAVLIAGRLPDENPLDLALELSQNDVNGIIIVIDRGELFEAHDVLDGSGVTILANPLTRNALIQAIRLVMRINEGGGTLDRAKLMLVHQKGWTEPQAHRYIQKLSMDKRLPREVAAQIIMKALKREKEAQNDEK